ncbi:MAG TPA: type II toxin-antitoxin system VapC family toxin [Phycisphaerae bacterium]|nr:type II toxin-antitoxin system VapC family toxin [Phycisphaerae bacterium]
MIILDTDTLSIAQHPDSEAAKILHSHIVALSPDVTVGVTIISYEEQMRGWMEYIRKSMTRIHQLRAYQKLLNHVRDWRSVNVIPFDEAASNTLDRLRSQKLRIGTYDLKIAAVALTHDATLITRNLQHFSKVPGLRVQDWTKP